MASTSTPTRVDRLRFIVVVDNSVEWMTKLPPGFKHEVPHHLAHDPPIDSLTGAPVLDLQNYCCGAHGFSIVLETQIGDETYHTLFDAGPDSQSITRNLAALKIPTARIDQIVLSHWHADHTGGLTAFLNHRRAEIKAKDSILTSRIVLDLHPDRPDARALAIPGPKGPIIARMPADPTLTELEQLGGTIDLHAEPHTVAGGTIYVSGEVPRVTSFEAAGFLGAKRWSSDPSSSGWHDEPHLQDERYIAIDVRGKGLVLFTACSHAGAINIVRDAVKQLGRPIYMLVGGLHLAGPGFVERTPPTVDFLTRALRPAPTYVLPMHCSGFVAKAALQKAFGDAVVPAGTGDSYEVIGTPDGDDRLFVEIADI